MLTICTTFYVSETYYDSSVPCDDPRLNLSGYKLVRADSLSNNKRSGASTGCQYYFKETFAVRPVPINNLKECILLEVFIIIIKITKSITRQIL